MVTWYVPDAKSSQIVTGPLTPSDEDLAIAIDQARRQGLDIVLVMHVDSLDKTWRGYMDPTDKDAWFASYRDVLNHYADLAQQNYVQGLVLGSEMVQLTKPEFTGKWQTLIRDVRDRFSGFLTYSAEWGGSEPTSLTDPLQEYTQIGFWPDLDYLGISAYFTMATETWMQPANADLLKRWQDWRKYKIDPFQAKYDKPLVFTEIGYKSTAGDAARSWDSGYRAGIDVGVQEDLYAAFFEAWHDVPWFRGVYFWYWSTNPDAGGAKDQNYTPQNKPAEGVVKDWFTKIEQEKVISPTPTAVPEEP